MAQLFLSRDGESIDIHGDDADEVVAIYEAVNTSTAHESTLDQAIGVIEAVFGEGVTIVAGTVDAPAKSDPEPNWEKDLAEGYYDDYDAYYPAFF